MKVIYALYILEKNKSLVIMKASVRDIETKTELMVDHQDNPYTQRRMRTSWQGLALQLPSADMLGIFASLLCLLHCLAMPVVVMTLPALGVSIWHDDRTHYCLALFVVLFCLVAIIPGYLKHGNRRVLISMSVGLSLVLFATFGVGCIIGNNWEVPLISTGNVLVVVAHWYNSRQRACCKEPA